MAKKDFPSETAVMPARAKGATPRDRGLLAVTGGPAIGRVVSIGEEAITTVGRAEECAIFIGDGGLSREHARITQVAGMFVFTDQKSRNGSFVNDQKVADPVILKDGDRLQLGPSTTLTFSLVDSAEEAAMKHVYETTLRDALTGLYNRRHLEQQLGVEVTSASRRSAPLSIAMLDIDHFKKVNDTHGHAAGDAVLRTFAQTLLTLIRPRDFLARYGGEEFTLVLPETDGKAALLIAERIRATIEATPIVHDGTTIRITSSCGVASLADCGDGEATTLGRLADERLYEAKRTGRNRIVGAT